MSECHAVVAISTTHQIMMHAGGQREGGRARGPAYWAPPLCECDGGLLPGLGQEEECYAVMDGSRDVPSQGSTGQSHR
jgi:hypothetical protein